MDIYNKIYTMMAALLTTIFSLFMYHKHGLDQSITSLQQDVTNIKVKDASLTTLVETIHEDVKEIKDLLQQKRFK